MNKIEVAVLEEHGDPGKMMMFLAKLTQRGHSIKNMSDLKDLYESTNPGPKTIERVAALPHGTIKRFTPITIAIVGASRRFLAQIRTHQIGCNFVSASLQYSDYSGEADFVVPYAIMEADYKENEKRPGIGCIHTSTYLEACKRAMCTYEYIAKITDNDSAGYAAPQGLRNILILQANHDSWMHLIRMRGCNRNTPETQYVVMRIWEELLKTTDGKEMFKFAGPDCMFGVCKEGNMCCGKPLKHMKFKSTLDANHEIPTNIIRHNWPLLVDTEVAHVD